MRKLRKKIEKVQDAKRFEHTLGVEYTAAALAMCHGASVEDARRVEDRVVQTFREDREVRILLLDFVGDRTHEGGTLLRVGEVGRLMPVSRAVAGERREDAELVVENAVRAEATMSWSLSR